MPPIPNRIPSESSTDGLVRTHSSQEIQSADSVDSDQADPVVAHVPHVDRIPRRPRRHHRSCKHRRALPIEPVHPRRRHISARMEVPDLQEIKEAIAVQEDECLRHYLYKAFVDEFLSPSTSNYKHLILTP